jgi:cytochrome P450 family 97 subfamily B polypeptide 3
VYGVQTVAESLRMFPQPPVLIRRATEEVTLPPGSTNMKDGVTLQPGCDMFISTWNLHRSPYLWENPEKFDPSRFTRAFSNPDMPAWEGFDPNRSPGTLYTNEVS